MSPRTVSSAHTRIFTLNRWYFLTLVLFALGLMAKPMLVTLPFVLLLLDWWPLGRLSVGRRWSSGTPGRPSAWIVLLEKLPFLALTAGSMALTWWAQYGSGAVETWEDSGLGFRLGNAVVAYAVYLRKMLLPWDLAVFYPRPLEVFPAWQVVISLAALSVLTVAAFRQARRRPWLLAGWCWYLGMLLPVIGLVQVGSQAWADRYTYLPVLGIFWALALLGREVSRRGRSPRALVAGIGVAALAACVVLTFLQIGLWRDTESLFNRAIRVTEKNWVAHTSLGAYLSRQKRLDEAIPHYREALRWAPYYRKARFNLGLALAQQGKLPEAVEQLSVAVELDPDYTKAQHNLALALQRLGRDAEAVIHFQEAIRLMPDNADMRHQLAVSLARLGRMEEARQQEAAAMDLIRRGM